MGCDAKKHGNIIPKCLKMVHFHEETTDSLYHNRLNDDQIDVALCYGCQNFLCNPNYPNGHKPQIGVDWCPSCLKYSSHWYYASFMGGSYTESCEDCGWSNYISS